MRALLSNSNCGVSSRTEADFRQARRTPASLSFNRSVRSGNPFAFASSGTISHCLLNASALPFNSKSETVGLSSSRAVSNSNVEQSVAKRALKRLGFLQTGP